MRFTTIKKGLQRGLYLVGQLPAVALASDDTNYPWDSFLIMIKNDLTSNVALSLGIMGIVICGLAIAFGDLQRGTKRAVTIGLGISIAVAAPSIIQKLFNVSGAII